MKFGHGRFRRGCSLRFTALEMTSVEVTPTIIEFIQQPDAMVKTLWAPV